MTVPRWLQLCQRMHSPFKHHVAWFPTRSVSSIQEKPPPFPVIPTCPSPTCACADTPPGLDIDRKTPLNWTMPPYAQQVVISTGQDDWISQIDNDKAAVFGKELKRYLGRGGRFHDVRVVPVPYHNTMISHSSFIPAPPTHPTSSVDSAFIFPSFRYVPMISDGIVKFIQAFLLPKPPQDFHGMLTLPEQQSQDLVQGASLRSQFRGWRAIDEVVVLICGHGGRDERCGIMGPSLRTEFETALTREGFDIDRSATRDTSTLRKTARVGLITHVGGHKWAGNVIIYIPPTFQEAAGPSPLAGRGIWYGRVEPRHVEGIVGETIRGGRVIAELFRGGIGQNGERLKL